MLVKVEISNYKSIGHASLSFSEETVIVGPNGVGKSNLLDAIHFLRDSVRDGLDHAVTKRHGVNSIRRWSKTKPYNISLRFAFSPPGSHGEYRVSIASAAGDFSVIEEEGMWVGPNPFPRSERDRSSITCTFKRLPNGKVKFEIPENPFLGSSDPTFSEADLVLSQLGPTSFIASAYFFRGLFEQVTSCGAYSIYPNKIREPQTISNVDTLADDGTNLASVIRQMRSTSYRSSRENLTTALKQVMPIVNEIRIESAGGFYVPVFRVREPDSGYSHDLNMSQISDGTLRMLGMLTAFYQPKAPVRITLEEPEQMIHPGLLPVLLDASRDYVEARPNVRQTFFTTHSPGLLDMFKPTSIIGAMFEDGVSKFHPLSDRQMKIVKEQLFSPGELLLAEGIGA